jgi:hypothetical protein
MTDESEPFIQSYSLTGTVGASNPPPIPLATGAPNLQLHHHHHLKFLETSTEIQGNFEKPESSNQ